MGDVTDERRKAAVEKAARAMCSVAWSHAYPDEQEQFCKDAQAALEAVGYFKLVEAAENTVTAYGDYEWWQPAPKYGPSDWSPIAKTIDTKWIAALTDALKEAV